MSVSVWPKNDTFPGKWSCLKLSCVCDNIKTLGRYDVKSLLQLHPYCCVNHKTRWRSEKCCMHGKKTRVHGNKLQSWIHIVSFNIFHLVDNESVRKYEVSSVQEGWTQFHKHQHIEIKQPSESVGLLPLWLSSHCPTTERQCSLQWSFNSTLTD